MCIQINTELEQLCKQNTRCIRTKLLRKKRTSQVLSVPQIFINGTPCTCAFWQQSNQPSPVAYAAVKHALFTRKCILRSRYNIHVKNIASTTTGIRVHDIIRRFCFINILNSSRPVVQTRPASKAAANQRMACTSLNPPINPATNYMTPQHKSLRVRKTKNTRESTTFLRLRDRLHVPAVF